MPLISPQPTTTYTPTRWCFCSPVVGGRPFLTRCVALCARPTGVRYDPISGKMREATGPEGSLSGDTRLVSTADGTVAVANTAAAYMLTRSFKVRECSSKNPTGCVSFLPRLASPPFVSQGLEMDLNNSAPATIEQGLSGVARQYQSELAPRPAKQGGSGDGDSNAAAPAKEKAEVQVLSRAEALERIRAEQAARTAAITSSDEDEDGEEEGSGDDGHAGADAFDFL